MPLPPLPFIRRTVVAVLVAVPAAAAAQVEVPPAATAQVTRPFDVTSTSENGVNDFVGDTYALSAQQGNVIQQMLTSVGLPAVNSMTLALQAYSSLVTPTTFTFGVTLNDVGIGEFSFLAPARQGNVFPLFLVESTLTFQPVAAIGGTYTLQLMQLNASIPSGGGVVGFDRDAPDASTLTFVGTTTSTVPEPGTWALLGTGLLAVGGIAARRRRRQMV